MTTNTWIAVEESFPPVGLPVLVIGDSNEALAVARLADAWSASEAEGLPIIVWADDQFGEELTFDPTHWQAIEVPMLA